MGEARVWRVRFICCGRDDGTQDFSTWEEANALRESYTSGPSVDPHGYSGSGGRAGHVRAAIIERIERA